MQKRQVIIKNGEITFIYADEMKPFLELGEATVKRVSHVEPTTVDGEVKWAADMSPVNGPVLGPYGSRQKALDEEVQWLNNNRLGVA